MPKIVFSVDPDLEIIAKPFRRNYKRYLDRKMETLARTVHKNIQAEAPERSGALRKAVVIRQKGNGIYQITVDKRTKAGKYEQFVRLGTRRHIIKPVRKKALYWPGARHPVKMVNHPGTKPNDYFTRGLENSQAEINQMEALIGSEMEASFLDDNDNLT